jgi:hypothetical protein
MADTCASRSGFPAVSRRLKRTAREVASSRRSIGRGWVRVARTGRSGSTSGILVRALPGQELPHL